tara:strand:+ start:233 stop:529 length:297 start_codon:yes stop_codon:yes gene_type:complete
MKITNNINVVRAWKNGKNARNLRSTLYTNEGKLYSYRLKVGDRTTSGITALGDFTAAGGGFRSMTTSRHIQIAKPLAEIIMNPIVWEYSSLSQQEVPF